MGPNERKLVGEWCWSDVEREKQWAVANGCSVVANMATERRLVAWAKDNAAFVYIGRPSKWGNKFKIGIHGTRDEVCEKHGADLVNRMAEVEDKRPPVAELAGKVLGCHCWPERCHGDALVDLANEFASRSQQEVSDVV
ncbi:MAG: DUF4326 domain-containing protein [Actinomycetota bacterium]